MTEPRGTQSIDIPDYAGLLDKYEALQRDRDDIHKNLVTVRVALADMESERHGLRAQVKMRDEEIAGLKQDMGADLVAALRRERAQLDTQLAGARKERAQFFADASRNATEREEQRTRAEKAEAELTKFVSLVRAWSAADFQYARAANCGESDPLQAAVEAYNSAQAALLAAVGITEYDKLSAVISAGGCEHRKELDRLYAPKPCTGCNLTMPLESGKVCDACKNSLPHALWLLFTATPMKERQLAGEAIWHILTARNRQNDDRTELRSEIEHLQRVSKAAHDRAEKAEGAVDDMGNQIALVRDWWYRRSREWKRSARGFRTKAKMFHSALLLAHKERDAVRAALDAFTRADTQPQIAGFLVANGEAVRFENGNVLPADPQTQIAHLRQINTELKQELARLTKPFPGSEFREIEARHKNIADSADLSESAHAAHKDRARLLDALRNIDAALNEVLKINQSLKRELAAEKSRQRNKEDTWGYQILVRSRRLERALDSSERKRAELAMRLVEEQKKLSKVEERIERERASRRAAEGIAAIAKKDLEKTQAEIAAQKNDLADLELERQKAVAESASRFDCHRGPGTTEPGCGGCVSCLLRIEEGMAAKVVRAEKERDAAITRLRETDLLRRENIAEAQSLRARLAELTPQPPKE
ncbi:MAG TPA: hypothetical protein PKV97_00085 [Thauera aminoaromatica]|nr:hypothetical protein [Thauera aminoaromatica]